MSWAQLSNRPNNVSHQYSTNHNNNTYYRKPSNNNHNRILINNNNSHNQQPRVPTTSSKHKHNDVSYVILDSGAFIGRQSFFNNFSPNTTYYMTPAVNHEIRDKQSRHFLDNFPYQIIVKKPDPQSVQYVSKFIAKNPTLRSLSKVDRQIIALAHTLELQKEGNKNIQPADQKNKVNKAMSLIENQNFKKQIKKSKTGRVHTHAEPINDTGVRLSKLKKIIPFHFDDFMTMTKQQYGEKYGIPTPIEMIPHSPKFKGKLGVNNMQKTDPILESNNDVTAVKYNPNVKAKTECNETMSKSQRRRKRKKMARSIGNKDMTAENIMEFGMIDDEDKDSDENDEIKLENDGDNDNDNDKKIINTHEHGKTTDDIDAMIEEDLNNTFNETASLISSLSAQSAQHKKQINDINKRLNLISGSNHSNHSVPPSISQSQSQPVNGRGFGTMFNGEKGSIFGDNNSNGNMKNDIVKGKVSGNPLPALPQNKEIEEKKTVNDAWNGEWLTPDNYKKVPKNQKKQKKKLKNVDKSFDSCVAVITVDKAMQRCMVDMGLRVLTTNKDRQYGGSGGGSGSGNGSRDHNGNDNGEPINYIFRCYGCFQYEHNTNRTHCRWCGGQTYQRVAIYEDQNGKHHYRYYYRDRYGHKYLDKHSLVPKGSQLVKYNQTNHKQNNNHHMNPMNHNTQKRKKKKRAYLGNNNNYRGGGRQNRW